MIPATRINENHKLAIEEHDREDLLRDGRMMPLRGEISIDGVTVVVGFRDRGGLSLYWGADPVFQFNTRQELRRVFLNQERYAAEGGRLGLLSRDKRGGRVVFVRDEIDDAAELELRQLLMQRLARLKQAVGDSRGHWSVAEGDVDELLSRITDWFERLAEPIVVADSPNAR